MPPAIPNDDLGLLITLSICITLVVLLATAMFTWMIMRQNLRSQEISERVAGIAERLDVRLRRQYADIDRELQDSRDALQ